VLPEVIGATGVEVVASQIYHGQTGRHGHPQNIAISQANGGNARPQRDPKSRQWCKQRQLNIAVNA
jgi:hypothetical protein